MSNVCTVYRELGVAGRNLTPMGVCASSLNISKVQWALDALTWRFERDIQYIHTHVLRCILSSSRSNNYTHLFFMV